MNFVIRIENGQLVDHPIAIENFRQAFPNFDENNLPPEFVEFKRVPKPNLGPYETMDSFDITYQFIDGVWTDVWPVREMTNTEKSDKIAVTQSAWAERNQENNNNWSAWTFDEPQCAYVPPIPRPSDDKRYFWHGPTLSWVELPQRPNDGKIYKLDFTSGTWVEVTP